MYSGATHSQLIGYHRTPNHDVEIFQSVDSISGEWKMLEKHSKDPFSNRYWAESWYKAHEHDKDYQPIIILGKNKSGRPDFILPLVKKRFGPFNILMRPGFKHSTYYSGIYSPEFEAQFENVNPKQFWPLVFSFIPQTDAVILDGIYNTGANPLSYLPLVKSSNSAFSMELEAHWHQQYQDLTSSRAKRNDKRCRNRLSDLGEVKFQVANSADEKVRYLDTLLELKAAQFEKMGVYNAYKSPEIKNAYRLLAETSAQHPDQDLIISVLMLDGEVLAASLGMRHDKEYHGLILAMTTGALKKYSPGRLLLLDLNEHLAKCGVRTHDFGTGSSSYKLNWCNHETARYNAIAPLSIKGRILTPAIRFAAKNKNWLKNIGAVKWAYFKLHKS